jgi:DNA-binding response OmpR family regulator
VAVLLVVEDDVHQAQLYEQELCEDGYRVIVANSGHEALQKLDEQQVDLAILDIRMPGIDGVELLGRLLSRDSTMPVILHSAYAHYKDNFMTWTADHYVIKSSDLTGLKDKIRETLARRTFGRQQTDGSEREASA